MSNKLIQLLNDKKGFKDIKLVYSNKLNILCIFLDKKLYIIDNIADDPKIRFEKDLNIKSKIQNIILHPHNENQIILINEDSIFIIPNLTKFSREERIQDLKISSKNIISIKFSYFNNCFGILYKNRTFIYYLLKDNNELEEICNTKNLEEDYIDFNFCPLFSKGFEIFMAFFMTKDGRINMYGPFFPNEFYISKEYFFNMNNYLIYKLSLMDNDTKNNQENMIYCLSLHIIDDLKNSIIEQKSDKDNYFIKISEKMKVFNATFRKKEIKLHNNFLVNSGSEIFGKKYKQIHILNKKPLTIMRISNKNDIDLIMLGEEIMPLELAQTGNFTFNVENNNNNFFIEFISLNNNNEEKEKIKIFQYMNESLFIKTENSLFLIKIPYLNKMKTIAEEKLKDIPNKMNRTSIIKLFKWNNNINNNNMNNINHNNKIIKTINVEDILIEPNNKKLYIFGILKEQKKEEEKESMFGGSKNLDQEIKITLKIKEKDFGKEEEKFDLSKFENLLIEKSGYDNQINDIKNKLKENEFIDIKNIKKKIEVDEKLLNNKKINFENEVNNGMNMIYNAYKNIINNSDEVFNQKINIMKYIYNNLIKSEIKLTIDNILQKIDRLKIIKNDVEKQKSNIHIKIEEVKKKMNQYELDDEIINKYLNKVNEYQKTIEEKIVRIDSQLDSFEKNIENIFSFTQLFSNIDLEFNLIEKENQDKYMEFRKKILNNSKNINQAINELNKK